MGRNDAVKKKKTRRPEGRPSGRFFVPERRVKKVGKRTKIFLLFCTFFVKIALSGPLSPAGAEKTDNQEEELL